MIVLVADVLLATYSVVSEEAGTADGVALEL